MIKKYLYNAALILTSLAIVTGAAGCEKSGGDAVSSLPVETVDQTEKTEPEELPDIGEHKDYAEQDAKCYESGSILAVEQDSAVRGMEKYKMQLGSGCLEFYANELNKIKELAGNKVRVYSMIVPTACELYCPKNERDSIDSQAQVIADVKDMLLDVEQVDVLPTLINHNAEDIYYRTDNRWTPLGAYYAGKVFAKAAGVPYADISEYTPTEPKDYIGDLAETCGADAYADFEKNPDKFSYFKPKASFKTNYYDDQFKFLATDKFYEEVPDSLYDSYYKGGFYCLRLDTKVKNGRRLLLVKDSFGTSMPTFFTGSFSEIYVVSYNYLGANLSEVIEEFGITDVLYVLNTFIVTDTRVYTLETLRTQATHGSLKDDAPEESDIEDTEDSESDADTEDTENADNTDDPFAGAKGKPVEYIYGVGLNNQIGIVESSDEDYTQSNEFEEEDVYTEEEYSSETGEQYVYEEEDNNEQTYDYDEDQNYYED